MFGVKTDDLNTYLQTSSVINTSSRIIAEWNLNIADNIENFGNYFNRPNQGGFSLTSTYTTEDENTISPKYYGATESQMPVDGGIKSDGTPYVLASSNEKNKLLFSLENCLNRFRPRSGINKAVFYPGRYFNITNEYVANRPRYYAADKDDVFKYWSSFKTEVVYSNGLPTTGYNELGISKNYSGVYYIDDAAPFVVYRNSIPANRMVIKTQTHVGTVNLSSQFSNTAGSLADPFYGTSNKTIPTEWRIETLQGNTWTTHTGLTFTSSSTRSDGSPIIKEDGYVELAYGITNIPSAYTNTFIHIDTITSVNLLPQPGDVPTGYAYLVKTNSHDKGTFYVNAGVGNPYTIFVPNYGWYVNEEGLNSQTSLITELTSPDYYLNSGNTTKQYRDFSYIRGIRIVVTKMNRNDVPFELIEISPRLAADLSDKAVTYSAKKIASDLGLSGMPVGQLLASTGSLELFDYDQAFNANNPYVESTNTGSIISEFLAKNMQIKFYENISTDTLDQYVPIKTLYTDGFPKVSNVDRTVNLELRDLLFYFESIQAPQLLIPDVSFSFAVSTLLDAIGFSNYSFKRVAGETDPIIPYFFTAPDMTVAQVLQDLAVSTQTAVFFDEYNNLIFMSKNYMMPTLDQRSTNITLYGTNDQVDNGIVENAHQNSYLTNIVDIKSADSEIYNDGKIVYSNRSIQRSYRTIQQASQLNQDKTWIYKPVLLWEVASKSENQSGYTLSAIPLKTTLSTNVPSINTTTNKIENNTMDLGESIYWLGKYNGYLYANGEVIKFDAVEYNIPGRVKSATITNAVASGGIVTYTANNNFAAGEYVSITGINVTGFNVTSANIISATPTQFSIKNSATGTYSSGGDAVIDSNVWVTNDLQYKNYSENLRFGGQIFPTGNIRIYAKVSYNTNGTLKAVVKHGRGQFGTTIAEHKAGLSDHWTNPDNAQSIKMNSSYLYNGGTVTTSIVGPAGISTDNRADHMTATGIIQNFLSSRYEQEAIVRPDTNISETPGTIQSSALVLYGPTFSSSETPRDYMCYVHKTLDNSYKHFGTRMRVIGNPNNDSDNEQNGIGSQPLYIATGGVENSTTNPKKSVVIGGAGGGLGFFVNTSSGTSLSDTSGQGYFFEISALTTNNLDGYTSSTPINNVFFYKNLAEYNTTTNAVTGNGAPIVLWSGLAQILVDDGKFTGQSRQAAETAPTVYDLSVEYETKSFGIRFYLYINDKLIATVDDTDPLPIRPNVALFVRGSSKVMFENLYALKTNYATSPDSNIAPASSVFNEDSVSAESFRKYALSGSINSTFLSSIGTGTPPDYQIYFEEFGTIMRECDYFNIRYDKAYPALLAQLSPTFNNIQGYAVSNFRANAYGAEFLVFNTTDTVLVLDETTGNYLRIQGVTFTQESNEELTVDQYFNKKSDFRDSSYAEVGLQNYLNSDKSYLDVKNSRLTYGRKDFTLDAKYIQNLSTAYEMMDWIISKIMKPRRSVGMEIFGLPTLQLGDIVNIDYTNKDGVKEISPDASRFVVYSIEYQRNPDGVVQTVYVSEVI